MVSLKLTLLCNI